MYLWMPMVAWGVVKLACELIRWRARIAYERTRAAAVVDVLRAVPADVNLRDSHADGTMLCIEARPIRNSGALVREINGGTVADRC